MFNSHILTIYLLLHFGQLVLFGKYYLGIENSIQYFKWSCNVMKFSLLKNMRSYIRERKKSNLPNITQQPCWQKQNITSLKYSSIYHPSEIYCLDFLPMRQICLSADLHHLSIYLSICSLPICLPTDQPNFLTLNYAAY